MAKARNREQEPGKTAPIASPALKEKSRARARRVSRGIALFLGAFGLLNVLADIVSTCPGAGLWWLDFAGVEGLIGRWGHIVVLVLEALGAVLLVAWSVRPGARPWRSIMTALFAFCFAAVGLWNTIAFWQQLVAGKAAALVPVPAAFVLALAFAFVAVRAWTSRNAFERSFGSHGIVGTAAVAIVCVLAFPILQVATYGTATYQAQAGQASVIVPGARLAEDGGLSPLLKARMDSGIALVEHAVSGSRLIVSGGTEASGKNEADAMAAYAREKLGSGAAVVEDQRGTSLEAMVKDTLSMADDSGEILVTSSFYQTPRIRMLFLAAGSQVRTVPVMDDLSAEGTPASLAREVGAWWQTWLTCYL